jgi:hypothetical protein
MRGFVEQARHMHRENITCAEESSFEFFDGLLRGSTLLRRTANDVPTVESLRGPAPVFVHELTLEQGFLVSVSTHARLHNLVCVSMYKCIGA